MDASNTRGSYGDRGEHGGLGTVVIGAGLLVLIYGVSPGARHFYKYGRLPPAADTTAQWPRAK